MILVEKPEGNRSRERPRRGWVNNEIDLRVQWSYLIEK
jgi:hypothetical protein